MTVPLAFDDHGPRTGPVLVLGSSLGTDRRSWAPQLEALCSRFRVIRYDHRGHGASPDGPGPYTLPALAHDLLTLLEGLSVPRFSLAGLSLGGMVAIQVAALAPERVERLALFCTSAFLPPAQGWLDRAASVLTAAGTAAVSGVTERWFTPDFAAAHPDVVTAAREQLLATSPVGYAGCCTAIAAMDLRPELGRIVAPTLVVAADRDLAIPPPHAQLIAAGIAAPARLEIIPGAHLVSLESPEDCAALLLDHLVPA